MAKVNVFPGWYVVGATHVLLALIFGAAYSFGAFFTSIQEEFRVGSSSAASVFSFTALIYYAVGVFSGSVADRISTRRVIALGIVLLAPAVLQQFALRPFHQRFAPGAIQCGVVEDARYPARNGALHGVGGGSFGELCIRHGVVLSWWSRQHRAAGRDRRGYPVPAGCGACQTLPGNRRLRSQGTDAPPPSRCVASMS